MSNLWSLPCPNTSGANRLWLLNSAGDAGLPGANTPKTEFFSSARLKCGKNALASTGRPRHFRHFFGVHVCRASLF